jgi:hypothetical protein
MVNTKYKAREWILRIAEEDKAQIKSGLEELNKEFERIAPNVVFMNNEFREGIFQAFLVEYAEEKARGSSDPRQLAIKFAIELLNTPTQKDNILENVCV